MVGVCGGGWGWWSSAGLGACSAPTIVLCLGDCYATTFPMARISLCAMNARGLNCSVKRTSLLDVLSNHNIDIALISETRLSRGSIPRLEDKRYHLLSHSSATNSTKGVLIMARRNFEISILDSGGRFRGPHDLC